MPGNGGEGSDALKRLQKLKARAEEARSRKAQLEGRQDANTNRLQEEFPGLSSLKEAEAERDRLNEEAAALEAQVEEAEKDIRERFNW